MVGLNKLSWPCIANTDDHSHQTASKNWTIVNMIWKWCGREQSRPHLKYYLGVSLKRLRKTTQWTLPRHKPTFWVSGYLIKYQSVMWRLQCSGKCTTCRGSCCLWQGGCTELATASIILLLMIYFVDCTNDSTNQDVAQWWQPQHISMLHSDDDKNTSEHCMVMTSQNTSAHCIVMTAKTHHHPPLVHLLLIWNLYIGCFNIQAEFLHTNWCVHVHAQCMYKFI